MAEFSVQQISNVEYRKLEETSYVNLSQSNIYFQKEGWVLLILGPLALSSVDLLANKLFAGSSNGNGSNNGGLAKILFFFLVFVIPMPIVLMVENVMDIAVVSALIIFSVLLFSQIISFRNKWFGYFEVLKQILNQPPNCFYNEEDLKKDGPDKRRLSYVSAYKSIVMLATCIIILAVDFSLFPRKWTKTGTFGLSLMDLGVSTALISGGIVSRASRMSTTANQINGACLDKKNISYFHILRTSILSQWFLVMVGILRFIANIVTDHYVPPTEYGQHWNFFLTLAVVGSLSSILLEGNLMKTETAVSVSFIFLAFYEIYLTFFGGSNFIFNSERTNFFTANREGILGCVGYFALYCGSVLIGKLIFSKRTRKEQAGYLLSLGMFAGALTLLIEHGLGIRSSRRSVNASFVLTSLSFNAMSLFFFLLVEIIAVSVSTWTTGLVVDVYATNPVLRGASPNLLSIFMLANWMTGGVNMLMQTLIQPPAIAILSMTGYSVMLGIICSILYYYNIRLKFW